MRNKIAILIVLIFLIIIICCFLVFFNNKKKIENNVNNKNMNNTEAHVNNTIMNNTNEAINTKSNNIENKSGDSESEELMDTTVTIIVNNNEYKVQLEQNETVKEFLKLLPKEFNMKELNGNEKYTNLEKSLPTNEYRPNNIKAGDIMLYGDNCLVIFYKSFNSTFSYTKIGHIDNFEDLGNQNIAIKFEK